MQTKNKKFSRWMLCMKMDENEWHLHVQSKNVKCFYNES